MSYARRSSSVYTRAVWIDKARVHRSKRLRRKKLDKRKRVSGRIDVWRTKNANCTRKRRAALFDTCREFLRHRLSPLPSLFSVHFSRYLCISRRRLWSYIIVQCCCAGGNRLTIDIEMDRFIYDFSLSCDYNVLNLSATTVWDGRWFKYGNGARYTASTLLSAIKSHTDVCIIH